MTTTPGFAAAPQHPAVQPPDHRAIAPRPLARGRRIDRVTIALLVGVGAATALAGTSALALAALGSLL
ncbi:hypothetical protein [Agrococcus sp. SGAir0287]|uniref:hypothetical protein n=1 Tax=Agrococcus sp. SGAir0287 TaxID=2070347 RepID=UPI0010CD0888|nr:hypothetical protein [Agrococcus sp. SGAir0287]QCR18372.1 hypothetical protein C1N71_01980 [Agrococcus sp. SGAir0287]